MGASQKGVQAKSRTTASIAAGAGEAAPSSNPMSQAGVFFVEPFAYAAIATKCSTHTTFNLQLWGALDDTGSWYKINNGLFEDQASFIEEFSCAALKYIYPQIVTTSGAGSEAYTIVCRGVRKSEG